MTHCEAIREDIVAYLDHELLPEERERVDAHLAACPRCAEELRLFQGTWSLLERYEGLLPPSDFLARFLDRLAREKAAPEAARPGRLPRWAPWLAAAAVLVALVGVGSQFWSRVQNGAPAPRTAQLTPEERQIVQDLPILASPRFQLLRDLRLVEHYPVLSQLTEKDFEAL